MGSCLSKKTQNMQRIELFGDEEYDNAPMLFFNVEISSIKIREFNASVLKSKKASLMFKIKEQL